MKLKWPEIKYLMKLGCGRRAERLAQTANVFYFPKVVDHWSTG